MSTVELKWLTQMILKNCKLGLSHESILKKIHKDAWSLFMEMADAMVSTGLAKLGYEYINVGAGPSSRPPAARRLAAWGGADVD